MALGSERSNWTVGKRPAHPGGEFGFATLRDAAPGCGASVRERGGKDGPPVKGDGSILRAESREPRAESREPRAESREPRAESREPRAESREPRAESREPESRRAELCPRAQAMSGPRRLAGRRRPSETAPPASGGATPDTSVFAGSPGPVRRAGHSYAAARSSRGRPGHRARGGVFASAARRTAAAFLVLIAVTAAFIGGPARAGEIWSATLTPGSSGNFVGQNTSLAFGSITSNKFSIKTVTYTVKFLSVHSGRNLVLSLNSAFPADVRPENLVTRHRRHGLCFVGCGFEWVRGL